MSAQPARAYSTGKDLQGWCTAALDKQLLSGARAGLCVGFLDAFRQLSRMLPSPSNTRLECLPEGVGQEQFIRVILKYLDEHPEKLHLPAAQIVYDAANEAFPCPAAAK
ncbi:MAG: Rap1a/Tai family immunity protein [Terriglobales bacterium]